MMVVASFLRYSFIRTVSVCKLLPIPDPPWARTGDLPECRPIRMLFQGRTRRRPWFPRERHWVRSRDSDLQKPRWRLSRILSKRCNCWMFCKDPWLWFLWRQSYGCLLTTFVNPRKSFIIFQGFPWWQPFLPSSSPFCWTARFCIDNSCMECW